MDLLITLIYVPWYLFQGLIIVVGWYGFVVMVGKVINELRERW